MSMQRSKGSNKVFYEEALDPSILQFFLQERLSFHALLAWNPFHKPNVAH